MVRVTTPLIDITWIVLESAKDAGVADVVAACREAIVARRLGKRISEQTRDLILTSYEGVRA